MSVIGRLDGQVDEVLISPLARKNRGERDGREGERTAPPEPQSEAPARDEKQAPKQGELPVWLL